MTKHRSLLKITLLLVILNVLPWLITALIIGQRYINILQIEYILVSLCHLGHWWSSISETDIVSRVITLCNWLLSWWLMVWSSCLFGIRSIILNNRYFLTFFVNEEGCGLHHFRIRLLIIFTIYTTACSLGFFCLLHLFSCVFFRDQAILRNDIALSIKIGFFDFCCTILVVGWLDVIVDSSWYLSRSRTWSIDSNIKLLTTILELVKIVLQSINSVSE